MTQAIWNIEWLNQNAQRSYPLSEEATRRDESNTFVLPNDLIVDLVWPVQASASVQTDRFYISNIAVFGTGITISLGYWPVGALEGAVIGSVSVATSAHQRNQSYFISGIGDFFDSIGKITIGDLTNTLLTGGLFTFDLAGGRIEPTVVRPNLRGVSALILVNGQDRSDPIVGDVELVAGRNVRLVQNPNPGGNPQIRIDAISGAGLNQECLCSDTQPDVAGPIRTINGIAPDQNGNFLLQGDDCIELTAVAAGLHMKDRCSKACCGCNELEKIVQDLEQMMNQVSTMDGLTKRLDSTVQSALNNLLASKTSDLPCLIPSWVPTGATGPTGP
jgi:hypothetical protein